MKFADEYNELSYYTLSHSGNTFIHQHVVDAYIAQTANSETKPISVIFSLIGLYLLIEKNYTGREIQKAHLEIAKKQKKFQNIELPERRGDITVVDVLAEEPGILRDQKIKDWCASVWNAYSQNHHIIIPIAHS